MKGILKLIIGAAAAFALFTTATPVAAASSTSSTMSVGFVGPQPITPVPEVTKPVKPVTPRTPYRETVPTPTGTKRPSNPLKQKRLPQAGEHTSAVSLIGLGLIAFVLAGWFRSLRPRFAIRLSRRLSA